jgi:hypothetical protein
MAISGGLGDRSIILVPVGIFRRDHCTSLGRADWRVRLRKKQPSNLSWIGRSTRNPDKLSGSGSASVYHKRLGGLSVLITWHKSLLLMTRGKSF